MSEMPIDWAALLCDAVTKPGVISTAYRRFWNYSVGNQLLALWQCLLRGLEPGPINSFLGWIDLGRHVKKGEKAITLCMPVTVKHAHRVEGSTDAQADPRTVEETFTRFIYRPHWFVLCQTEGTAYVPSPIPEWDEARALEALHVERIPFAHLDGNAQGYALAWQVAISPVAVLPQKTLFHELAHVLLGHTSEGRLDDDDGRTPKHLREAEAESVALLCCESLSLGGSEFARGYIQHWLGKETIPERSAQRIFKAADLILKAGRPGTSITPDHS